MNDSSCSGTKERARTHLLGSSPAACAKLVGGVGASFRCAGCLRGFGTIRLRRYARARRGVDQRRRAGLSGGDLGLAGQCGGLALIVGLALLLSTCRTGCALGERAG